MRKVILWLIVLALIGGIVYGWLHYAVVGLYDPEIKQVSHMYVAPKPEWSFDIYYEHLNRERLERDIAQLKATNKPIPWHMDYNYVLGSYVYDFTLDSRTKAQRKAEGE